MKKYYIGGTIYRPFNFAPSKSYPVVENIYVGPHDLHVSKDFDSIEWSRSGFYVAGSRCLDKSG